MAGFGSGAFGRGPFGEADWAHLTVYQNVPIQVRQADTNGDLERFLQAFELELDKVRREIKDLPLQRDPLLARANEFTEDARVASVSYETDDDYGEVTVLTLELNQRLYEIGPDWVASINGERLTAVYVKTRTDITTDPNVIKCDGTVPVTVPPLTTVTGEDTGRNSNGSLVDFSFKAQNLQVVEGTMVVHANGVSDLTDDGNGNLSGVDGSGTIDYVTGQIDITYTTAPAAGDITLDYDYGGYLLITFRARNMLNWLAKDFGFDNDTNESETIQRSAIVDVTKWLELKSTARSYEIRSDISGFTAEAIGLYKVTSAIVFLLPADRTYLIDGVNYTDVDPKIIAFDDFRADVVPADQYCYEDTSPDGLSDGAAFALDLGTFTVTGVSGTAGAYQLDGTIIAAEHDLSANYDSGRFFLDNGVDPAIYIESEVSYAAPNWSVLTAILQAPSTGAYTLKYQCQYYDSCSWCRASVVVVKLASNPAVLGDDVDIPSAAARLQDKLEALVPVHVRKALFLLDFSASAEFTVPTVTGTRSVTYSGAGPGLLVWDTFPTDDEELDSDRMPLVTGTLTVT